MKGGGFLEIFLGFGIFVLDLLGSCDFYIYIFLVFPKVLMFLLKVTKVTTKHKKWPKMGKQIIVSSFFAQRAKKALAVSSSGNES